MATRKTAKPKVTKCPDCDGKGEITEAVRVGARKGRITDHRQSAMCTTCWGSGEIPADD